MKSIIIGKNAAPYCLIQAIDDHDAGLLQKEYDLIKEYTGNDILLAAFQVDDWNKDLSPWEAPPVFGDEPFGNGATKTHFKEPEVRTAKGFAEIIKREQDKKNL